MSEKRTKADKSQRQANQLEKKTEAHSRDPRLIADGNLQRCSVCRYPFPADVQPSMSVAFAEHLMKAHQPGQTSEDKN
jgi:hypothetical protein